MKKLKLFCGIFVLLAASRFIPHPPNFTSLIALSFYVPMIFGFKFITIVLTAFIITDLIIGIHDAILFTWGSIILIGTISNFYKNNLPSRFIGILFSCIIFYIVSNLGVWLQGSYGYNLSGFITCYILAIPFFVNTLIATIIYSVVIESLCKFIVDKKYFSNI